jgi:hypothetical protein
MGNPANGARLLSVTGYAFSERGLLSPFVAGQPNPTSLPIQVDASGASTYVVGDGPQLDGVVEASIDDATFASPRTATLLNITSGNQWQVQLTAPDLIAGSHTLYVRQRINGRDASGIRTVQFNVSPTIEQIVNSMVSMQTSNPSFAGGVASFNLSLTNTSSESIFTPLRLQIAQLTGGVTAANADNALTGPGAYWDYSNRVGADSVLSASEASSARSLRFSNSSNQPFSVTFNVIGNLARTGQASGSAGGASGSSSGSGSGSSGTSSSTDSLTSAVFKLTYNPLLNTVTVQLLQP